MKNLSKIFAGLLCTGGFCMFALSAQGCSPTGSTNKNTDARQLAAGDSLPKVYMTTDISPEGLMRVYKALGRDLKGKVAVKLSTGEPGGSNYLSPDLIKELVQSLNGTIVECNTAYHGKRDSTVKSEQVAIDHGFAAIAPVDIMDSSGSISLPFPKGTHIQEDLVGDHITRYNSFLILSHFKGHVMAGFGGAIKNMSIGIASAEGKAWIHSRGTSKTDPFGGKQDQNGFLESMAEAAGAVINYLGNNVAYINVMNKLSIDCDCDSHPTPPEMKDIGILASLDPVALDKACVDLVYQADSVKSASLRQRIESRNGLHTLVHAEELGLGSQKYELINIDARK
jgi:uncharacterized Fe-S center protein